MPELTPFQTLYDEYSAEVTADPDTELSDFSPGSRLDAYGGLAATAAQSIMRWIARQVRRVFVSTAEGGDLDFAVADRFGDSDAWLTRRTGESDEDYRTRVLEYAENLGRGTLDALGFYMRSVRDDLETATVKVTEDLETGFLTLEATVLTGEDEVTVAGEIATDLPAWRPAAHGFTIDISGAT